MDYGRDRKYIPHLSGVVAMRLSNPYPGENPRAVMPVKTSARQGTPGGMTPTPTPWLLKATWGSPDPKHRNRARVEAPTSSYPEDREHLIQKMQVCQSVKKLRHSYHLISRGPERSVGITNSILAQRKCGLHPKASRLRKPHRLTRREQCRDVGAEEIRQLLSLPRQIGSGIFRVLTRALN